MTAPTGLDRFPTFAALREITDVDGYALDRLAREPVNGCGKCGRGPEAHQFRGVHPWTAPTDRIRKLRILARRHLAQVIDRNRAEHAALMAEIASWADLEAAAPKLRADEIRADVHEVLAHGEWRPVSFVRAGSVSATGGVWIGLGPGYSRFCPDAYLVPARETSHPTT